MHDLNVPDVTEGHDRYNWTEHYRKHLLNCMLADKSVQLKCNVEEEPPLDIWTVNYRLT